MPDGIGLFLEAIACAMVNGLMDLPFLMPQISYQYPLCEYPWGTRFPIVVKRLLYGYNIH
jgi:hypothetical protein